MRCISALLAGLLLTSNPYLLIAQSIPEFRIGAVSLYEGQEGEIRAVRFPIIPLNGGRVHIAFDLLGTQEPVLSYRIRHCDKDWKPSELVPIEYLSGLESHVLDMPKQSRNTLQPYMHYELELPNESTGIKLSGNYIVELYDSDEPSEILLRIPFAVNERLVLPQVTQTDRTIKEVRGKYHQIEVRINNIEALSSRPEQELSLIALQNSRWGNRVSLSAPSTISHNTISYTDFSSALFEAGNEYAKLEHLTDRGGGLGIKSTTMSSGLYRHELYPLYNTSTDSYLHEIDQNGLEVIRTLESDFPETDADYHLVDFSFLSPRIPGGQVIIEGQCVDPYPLSARTMIYNESKGRYEATILLKMGYQEYQYLFLAEGSSIPTALPTIGSHYQTSNDYTVLVYQRKPQERYDRLVGVGHNH